MPYYKKGNSKSYWQQGFRGPKRSCDVCGLWFYEETEMKLQNGSWKCIVGPHCYDDDEKPDIVSSVNHTGEP